MGTVKCTVFICNSHLKVATKAELEASCLHEISYIFNVYDGLNFSWTLKSANCYETVFAWLCRSKLVVTIDVGIWINWTHILILRWAYSHMLLESQ